MIHVYMLEMTQSDVFNGVTRCIQTLVHFLKESLSIKVTWIRLVYRGYQQTLQYNMDLKQDCTIYVLPIQLDAFLCNKENRLKCWKDIYNRYISPSYTKSDSENIFHVHTLNLIELAIFLKEKSNGKIVTHLHCIPWKLLYDREPGRYQQLYTLYYIQKNITNIRDFIFRDFEYEAYTQSDIIICVTQCAKDFLCSMGISGDKICVISNGLPDYAEKRSVSIPKKGKNIILFVGNMNPSKGLEFILRSLAQKEHDNIRLVVVGTFSYSKRQNILERFPFLDIQFTGMLSMSDLIGYYSLADIGIICSIHEQCSYVAIEMMMFGLPVICTSVDGLDEMFVH